jgi:predicted GNAT family N-acyltransferase
MGGSGALEAQGMTQGRPRVKLADTPAEWAGAVAVRLAVFVDEQHFSLTTEMDEHDRSAVHAIALLAVPVGLSPPEGLPPTAAPDAPATEVDGLGPARQGTALRAAAQAGKYLPLSLSGARTSAKDSVSLAPVVGTGRLLRTAGGVARIGRIAVLPEWRGQGTGSRILRLLEEAALARGARQVLVHAQVQAVDFYLRRGYGAPAAGEPFMEDGMPHQRMTKPLSPDM